MPDRDARSAVIEAAAEVVVGASFAHPTRVAVEGITGSGKTTFARELAEQVRTRNRPATVVTMDGYHRPASHRRRQGRLSGDGYYEDAYDLDAFRREVLEPLGPGGDRRCRPAIIDLVADEPVDPPKVEVAPDEILLVDGSFLGRPALAGQWDLRIWLEVPFEVAQARGVARDAERLGGEQAATEAFEQRYHAAFRRYLAECDPASAADIVVENTTPQSPLLVRPRR
jgi:uridine kinase